MGAVAGEDLEQQVIDALVSALDRHELVTAVTQRADTNVFLSYDAGTLSSPLVVLTVGRSIARGGTGENYDVPIIFGCVASITERDARRKARQLRRAVLDALRAIGTLTDYGLDAVWLPGTERFVPVSWERERAKTARADLAVTFWVTVT